MFTLIHIHVCVHIALKGHLRGQIIPVGCWLPPRKQAHRSFTAIPARHCSMCSPVFNRAIYQVFVLLHACAAGMCLVTTEFGTEFGACSYCRCAGTCAPDSCAHDLSGNVGTGHAYSACILPHPAQVGREHVPQATLMHIQ